MILNFREFVGIKSWVRVYQQSGLIQLKANKYNNLTPNNTEFFRSVYGENHPFLNYTIKCFYELG